MTTLAALGLACDLRAEPWTYPGHGAPHAGVLVGDRFLAATPGGADGLDAVLRRERVAPVGQRALVVAVGSNGAPDVLRAKFERAGVSGVVPFVRAEVHGVGVGHSAHVSLPGFVAAAPFRAEGAVTPVVASFLDDGQVAALDVSERTYTRRWMAVTRCPVRLDGTGGDPAGWWLYDSDRGVLATAPGSAHPLRLQTQDTLLAHLAGKDPVLADLLDGVDARVVQPLLAASEARRTAIREHLAGRWALPSGVAPSAGTA